MTDPLRERDLAGQALDLVAKAAERYLDGLSERPVHEPATEALLGELGGPLPEDGAGTLEGVETLLRIGTEAGTRSSGPRFFHFVVGGATPAALAGDWIASLLDQNPGNWVGSPFATHAETVVLDWLKDLFGLPSSWGAVLTTSATSANFTALSAARYWWARRHGVNVTEDGLAGLPPMPVVSSGYIHVSTRKALQMLGLGRDTVRRFARDDAGRVNLAAMDRALAEAGGPAVIVANAGEVNAGDFDPIDEMAELAEQHGAWLHVDGAFGLFAALSPRSRHLVSGIERADSVISDGHKWLNVPYENGFAFVRDAELLGRAFGSWDSPYLPGADDEHINYAFLGPDSSRRARALPIWATLRAYGRSGYRAMVERHLDLAGHLGRLIEEAPDLEPLAPVTLCIACFRYNDGRGGDLDALNSRLGEELIEEGRVFAGTTGYRGVTALRPAIVNWRTTERDVELLVSSVREIGARLRVTLGE